MYIYYRVIALSDKLQTVQADKVAYMSNTLQQNIEHWGGKYKK